MNITPQIVEASLAAGNLKDAESQVDLVLKDHPDSSRAHLLKAEVLVKEGKTADSQKEFNQVVALDKTGDTVNSPMYKALTQEYVILNSHQQSEFSWGVLLWVTLVLVSFATWAIRRAFGQTQLIKEKLRKEQLKFQSDRDKLSRSFKEFEEEVRRKKTVTKETVTPVVEGSPTLSSTPSYTLPVAKTYPSKYNPYAESSVTAVTTRTAASPGVSPLVGAAVGAVAGVVLAETLLEKSHANSREEDDAPARRRRDSDYDTRSSNLAYADSLTISTPLASPVASEPASLSTYSSSSGKSNGWADYDGGSGSDSSSSFSSSYSSSSDWGSSSSSSSDWSSSSSSSSDW